MKVGKKPSAKVYDIREEEREKEKQKHRQKAEGNA